MRCVVWQSWRSVYLNSSLEIYLYYYRVGVVSWKLYFCFDSLIFIVIIFIFCYYSKMSKSYFDMVRFLIEVYYWESVIWSMGCVIMLDYYIMLICFFFCEDMFIKLVVCVDVS